MTAHDPLCACALREHSCQNSWAGTHCTRCECPKIARVRADERERGGAIARGMVAQARRDVAESIAAAIERNHAQSVADGADNVNDCTCEVSAAIARRHAEAQP